MKVGGDAKTPPNAFPMPSVNVALQAMVAVAGYSKGSSIYAGL
jgi:hypothetical protein